MRFYQQIQKIYNNFFLILKKKTLELWGGSTRYNLLPVFVKGFIWRQGGFYGFRVAIVTCTEEGRIPKKKKGSFELLL